MIVQERPVPRRRLRGSQRGGGDRARNAGQAQTRLQGITISHPRARHRHTAAAANQRHLSWQPFIQRIGDGRLMRI